MSSALPLTRPFADAKGHPLPQGERAIRERIVAAARGWIGTPYRHQASLKGVGCDCLGLLVGVWREVTGKAVGSLPPYTPDWAEANGRETLAEGLREVPDADRPEGGAGRRHRALSLARASAGEALRDSDGA